MQVASIKNSQNAVSFGGQRLFPVKLISTLSNGASESIDAFFTKMDSDDIPLAKNIFPTWAQRTSYGELIIEYFLNSMKGNASREKIGSPRVSTFMVEIPSEKSAHKRVKAMSSVSSMEDYLYVDYIQSASEMRGQDMLRGAGAAILYGITRLAELSKKNSIVLFPTPTSRALYKKFLFEDVPDTAIMILKKANFGNLIKFVTQEYNF